MKTQLALIIGAPAILPAIAYVKWLLRKDKTVFPFVRVFLCFLFVVLLYLYAELGPFYNVEEPVSATSAQEYFRLLAMEERPITITLWTMFFLQFIFVGKVLHSAEESSGFLVFSFGILAIYWSVFALLYAMQMLYINGIAT